MILTRFHARLTPISTFLQPGFIYVSCSLVLRSFEFISLACQSSYVRLWITPCEQACIGKKTVKMMQRTAKFVVSVLDEHTFLMCCY